MSTTGENKSQHSSPPATTATRHMHRLPDLTALDPAHPGSRASSPAAQALLERIIATPRTSGLANQPTGQPIGGSAGRSSVEPSASLPHRASRPEGTVPSRRRLKLLTLPLAAAALTATVTVTVFTATRPSGGGELVMAAPSAADLATWQASPQPVTGASKARAACLAEFGPGIADDPAAIWLLEERRGALTSMIASYGDQTAYCLIAPDGSGLLNSMTSGIEEDLTDQPSSGLTQAVSGDDLDGPADQQVHYVTGRYAPDVTAIALDLSDGRQVVASMQDGWYTAWWNGAALSSEAAIGWGTSAAPYTEAAFSDLPF